MGAEAKCVAVVDGVRAEGKALLETEELVFRSAALKAKVLFRDVRAIAVEGDALVLDRAAGPARFLLGAAVATKWADKIRSPRGILDKLGVKPKMRVAIVGDLSDASDVSDVSGTFVEQLRARDVVLAPLPAKTVDLIFFAVATEKELASLTKLTASLAPAGAIWIVRRKGKDAPVPEAASRAAAKKAGLVDVKVAKFSETHTAEKLVIPVAARSAK